MTTPQATLGLNDLCFERAGGADEEQLRLLLRSNPMPGEVTIGLEREPDYFLGASIEGDIHYTVVCREKVGGKIIAMGSWSTFDGWLDGRIQKLGYLGQLRVSPQYRGRVGILKRGYQELGKLAMSHNVAAHFSAIVEDNQVARRLLGRPKKGFPRYTETGDFSTLVLPLWRRWPDALKGEVTVKPAAADQLEIVTGLLGQCYSRYDFAPVWTSQVLGSRKRTRGLSIGDFLIAWRGSKPVGCLALWDQSGFKQSVVRDYSPTLKIARPLVNLAAPIINVPRLPPLGSVMRHVFFSHFAVGADDTQVALNLLQSGCNRARGRGFAYATLGIASRHPLTDVVKLRMRHRLYQSVVYEVNWGETEAEKRYGLVNPELALL